MSTLFMPSRLGPFRVLAVLGRGGTGTVYEALDPETGVPVAVKVPVDGIRGRGRIRREHQVSLRIDHPGVVRVLGCQPLPGGVQCLVMERLYGRTTFSQVRTTGLPGDPRRTAEAIRVVRAAATILASLHGQGLVHRDVKSSNLLVLADGRVKLLDLGTARPTGTRSGSFAGTVTYASPEQLAGDPVDGRSDLFALGALFYRLLTGRTPFPVCSPEEALAARSGSPLPRVADLVPAVPGEVAAVCHGLLDPVPSARPADAAAVLDALPDPGPPALVLRPGRQPLVGLEDALASVVELLAQARPGTLAWVEGPGTGRLLSAIHEECRRAGRRAISARGYGPAGVLGEILLAVPRHRRAAAEEGGSRREGRVAHVARVLARLARGVEAPVALLLTDLQGGVPEDRHAIERLRERLQRDGIPVVLVAGGEVAPPVDLVPPAPDLHLRLEPLPAARVDAWLQALLQGAVPPPGLASRVLAATGGRPLQMAAEVQALVERGALAAVGRWPEPPAWRHRPVRDGDDGGPPEVALARARTRAAAGDDDVGAMADLDRVEQGGAGDRAELERVLLWLRRRGGVTAGPGLGSLADSADASVAAEACVARARWEVGAGRLEDARTWLARPEAGLAAAGARARVTARLELHAGRLEEGLAALATVQEPLQVRAELLVLRGRFSEASAELARAVEDRGEAVASRCARSRLALDLHRLGRAEASLAQARELISVMHAPALEVRLAVAQAHLDVLAGRPGVPDERLVDAARACDDVAAVLEARMLRLVAVAAGGARCEEVAVDAVIGAAVDYGHLPLLARLCAWGQEALHPRRDPEVTFRPALQWIEAGSAPWCLLALQVARLRHARARGHHRQADRAVERGREVLQVLHRSNRGPERRALDEHPWAEWLQGVSG